MASFFREMIEEKKFLHEIIYVEHDGLLHFVEVTFLVVVIENTSEREREQIKNTFSLIDYKNGNLMHYLKFLANAYISNNYSREIRKEELYSTNDNPLTNGSEHFRK